MARQARKKSFTGYLHVIVRGIGKQILFEEKADYGYYLSLLKKYAEETGVIVCAYCLMENHVHLLVHDKGNELTRFMKKIGICYALYYNNKYDRTGHLFQDRFMSEPVETQEYLLTVFRYILNNPAKAGICPASEYLWSSYQNYDSVESFVDTTMLRQLIGDWEQYAGFIAAQNHDQCMEFMSHKKDDNWAKDVLRATLDVESGTVIQSYEKTRRNEALRKLKEAGLSCRQIERLTGIGRSIVQRI